MISNVLQNCKSLNFFVRHRHQHIKPSANEIAKVHILKADIFTLEKPDISIWGLHLLLFTN
ncbi:hypothetical protein B9T38_15510 [Acinetobacter sp. ANC 4218]|nr:hypothetical protein B9T38_15510 [Acinetobacter sp. ANC 4218]